MPEISKEVSDFISMVKKHNTNNGDIRHIRFDKQHTRCYCLKSGYEDLGSISGLAKTTTYYFKPEDFSPVIAELMKSGYAALDLDGVHVHESQVYDSCAHDAPNHEWNASVQKGHVTGKLKLENMFFNEYDLNFTPEGEAVTFEILHSTSLCD